MLSKLKWQIPGEPLARARYRAAARRLRNTGLDGNRIQHKDTNLSNHGKDSNKRSYNGS